MDVTRQYLDEHNRRRLLDDDAGRLQFADVAQERR